MKRMLRFMLLAFMPVVMVSCGPDTGRIKVVSFNLRYSNPNDNENYWENRKPATINMINSECPDVVGTQECLAVQDEYIVANLPSYGRIGVGRDDGDRGGEMMTIYYNKDRLDLVSSGNFWLSETPDEVSLGWDGACRRMVTWGCFRMKGSENSFYHFNTHLDHVGPVAREEGIKLIVKKIAEIVPDGMPYVVTGDLNSGTDEPIYEPLKEIAVSVRDVAPITDFKNSYNAYTHDTGEVIDHIFESGFTPLSFRTLDGDYGAPFISDHYPVVAELQF